MLTGFMFCILEAGPHMNLLVAIVWNSKS